jgi:hypothetical protein
MHGLWPPYRNSGKGLIFGNRLNNYLRYPRFTVWCIDASHWIPFTQAYAPNHLVIHKERASLAYTQKIKKSDASH